METNINQVLLMAFSVPDYARTDYFKKQQEKSGYSPLVFARLLQDSIKYYQTHFQKNHMVLSKDAQTTHLPLLLETHGRLRMTVDEGDILSLGHHIGEALLHKEEEPAIKNKPSRREALIQAHLENKGVLTNDQVKQVAAKYKFDEKGMLNFYGEIKDDIKKLK